MNPTSGNCVCVPLACATIRGGIAPIGQTVSDEFEQCSNQFSLTGLISDDATPMGSSFQEFLQNVSDGPLQADHEGDQDN